MYFILFVLQDFQNIAMLTAHICAEANNVILCISMSINIYEENATKTMLYSNMCIVLHHVMVVFKLYP